MTIAATLYERTPYRLVYKLVADGQGTASPDTGVIRNRDVAPAVGIGDLSYDADTWHDSPIDKLVNTAGITTGALAARLLNGSGLTAVADLPVERGHLQIIPFNGTQDAADNFWSVTADSGASVDPGARPAGSDDYACIEFWGPNANGATAILSLELQYSMKK